MPAISFSVALHAGDHQQGDQLGVAVRFQCAAEVRPAHTGHDHIHHHQIDLLVFQHF